QFTHGDWSISSAGDVNGDGFSDIIIGEGMIRQSFVIFGGRIPFLNVNAINVTTTYGTIPSSFEVELTGFMDGDTTSSLSSLPVASTTATPGSLPGTYPISVGGGASAVYAFNYKNGLLTILKAPLTVTPNSISTTYGT